MEMDFNFLDGRSGQCIVPDKTQVHIVSMVIYKNIERRDDDRLDIHVCHYICFLVSSNSEVCGL